MTPCYGCDVKLICSQGVHCGCVIDSVAGAMVRVAKANLEHADIARRTLLEMLAAILPCGHFLIGERDGAAPLVVDRVRHGGTPRRVGPGGLEWVPGWDQSGTQRLSKNARSWDS